MERMSVVWSGDTTASDIFVEVRQPYLEAVSPAANGRIVWIVCPVTGGPVSTAAALRDATLRRASG